MAICKVMFTFAFPLLLLFLSCGAAAAGDADVNNCNNNPYNLLCNQVDDRMFTALQTFGNQSWCVNTQSGNEVSGTFVEEKMEDRACSEEMALCSFLVIYTGEKFMKKYNRADSAPSKELAESYSAPLEEFLRSTAPAECKGIGLNFTLVNITSYAKPGGTKSSKLTQLVFRVCAIGYRQNMADPSNYVRNLLNRTLCGRKSFDVDGKMVHRAEVVDLRDEGELPSFKFLEIRPIPQMLANAVMEDPVPAATTAQAEPESRAADTVNDDSEPYDDLVLDDDPKIDDTISSNNDNDNSEGEQLLESIEEDESMRDAMDQDAAGARGQHVSNKPPPESVDRKSFWQTVLDQRGVVVLGVGVMVLTALLAAVGVLYCARSRRTQQIAQHEARALVRHDRDRAVWSSQTAIPIETFYGGPRKIEQEFLA